MSQNLRILVVVDGPPTTTGKHARYPAMPIIIDCFAGAQIDFLLDDYDRKDEKEVVKKWLKDVECKQLKFTLVEMKMEKDACLIKVSAEK